jgi:DivIVA domain-containing protein
MSRMTGESPPGPERTPIGVEDVARKEFSTGFRGYDQHEVRAYLGRIAAELAAATEREHLLRERLHVAEQKPAPNVIPEDDLDAVLGQEAARVLHAAREAAAEIRARAEEQVARLLREANDEGTRVRHEAERLLGVRTEEAERVVTAMRQDAERTAAAMREEAARAAAEEMERAQHAGRDMVAEAQAVRERLLRDLARRRRHAHQQLEQLRAGRERLLESYRVVRSTLDEATRELTVAEAEARAAAEAAALRVADEPEATLEELEAEVIAARDAGLTVPVTDLHDVHPVHGPDPVSVERVREPEPEPEPEPQAHAEVTPEPESEPEPILAFAAAPQEQDHDDRRSSSLRLLRRKSEPPIRPLTAVTPHEDVEGVRIIRAAPEPEPEPEPEVAVELAPEPEAPAVEDLFARIRADRAAAMAAAEAVLADPEPEPEPTPTPEPEPEPEPEPDVVVDLDESVLQARDVAVEPIERTLVKALKRELTDEQNEVLDALRRHKGTATVEALLPPAEEHAGRYATAAVERLAEAAGSAVAVDDLAGELGAEVAGVLRSRLGRAIDEVGGDDDVALTDALSAAYRESKTSRIEPLSRHAVVAAHARGAYAAAPDDRSLRWVVDPEEGGCPDCDDNVLAGPTAKGEPFPTGQPHPPAHTGCRCVVVPA